MGQTNGVSAGRVAVQNLQDKRLNRLGRSQISLSPTMVFRVTSPLDGCRCQTNGHTPLDGGYRLNKIRNHIWSLKGKRKDVPQPILSIKATLFSSCPPPSLIAP